MQHKAGITGKVLLALVLTAAGFCPSALSGEQEDASNQNDGQSGENNGEIEVETPSFIRDGKLDLEAVVDYFEDMYRSDSSISSVKLIVTRPRFTRTLEMKIWTRGDEKALIVIQAPTREKGTTTLKVGDNLWNYFPKIDRTIRIPPSMMLRSWMGSDFTNDDLVKEADISEDYEYELAGSSENPKGWKVIFTAKEGTVGLWKKFELILNEKGTIPLRAEYYDRKGRLARTMIWSDIKVFDGRKLPSHLTLLPEDEEGHKTELIYEDIDFDVDVPESMFSLSQLERRR